MITIQCDNCDKMFEVADSEAGGKAPCPACGDVNRVPPSAVATATVPAAAAAASTAAAAPRSAAPSMGSEGEKEIVVIRPAMFRAHPFKYLLLVLVFAGGVTLAVWTNWLEPNAKWWALAGGLV